MKQRLLTLTSMAALVASLGIVGCSPQDRSDAKKTTNESVAQVENKARELGNDAKEAGKNVGDKVADAVITTSVKAELAKDSTLSAMKINVDTANGKVALQGTAPSSDARRHATTLAQGVKGVTSVDNQLSVEAKK